MVLFLLVLTAAAGWETSVWHSAAEVSRQVCGRLPSTDRPAGSGWANTTWHLPAWMIHRSGGASSGGLSSPLTGSGSHVGPLSCWSTLELRWHCGKPGGELYIILRVRRVPTINLQKDERASVNPVTVPQHQNLSQNHYWLLPQAPLFLWLHNASHGVSYGALAAGSRRLIESVSSHQDQNKEVLCDLTQTDQKLK